MPSHLPALHLLPLCALMLAGSLSGCTILGKPEPAPPEPDYPTVNEGYNLLYEVVSTQKFTDKLLLIKIESDAVDAVISELSEDAARMEAQLQEIAREDPTLDLEREILPEVERRKRDSVQMERLKDLLGGTGKRFERLLLLTQSGALNQTRHLARVVVETEAREDRKAFWREVQRQFDENYRNVVELLESEYFIHH
jgi:hypothetical protein